MSLKKYRAIDILVFCVIAIVFESLNYFASTNFEDFKLIFMSYSIVLAIIAIYRWGLRGIAVSICGGLAACIVAKSQDYIQYVSYTIGSLALIIPVLIFQYGFGRKSLQHKWLQIIYLVCSFVVVVVFRCLTISLFHFSSFFDTFVTNIRYETVLESMSLVISIIILLIASRKSGQLFVEMKGYIKDVQDRQKLGGLKEYQESPNFNSDKPFTEEDQIDNSYLLDGGTLSKQQMLELDKMFKDSNKRLKDDSKEE